MTVEYYRPSSTPNIEVSAAAIMRFTQVMAKEPQAIAMRLSVKRTGCSGYAYDLKTISEKTAGDFVIALSPDLDLFVDAVSYELLKGLHIDYVKQGIQAKFVYSNPQQTGQCGCGESFTIESL
jgi:iron-sulfur cluster assembly protein